MSREKANAAREQERAFIEAARQERDYILNESSPAYFIEQWCKIESKDDPANPVIPFRMWDSQKKALQEIIDNKLNIVLKARQLGFTWMIICYIIHQCFRYGGYTALILSETEAKSKELINRVDFVLRHLPEWLVISEKKYKELKRNGAKYTGIYWIKTTLSVELHYGDDSKEVSSIKAQACTEGAGRSLTGDIVFFDEWAFHTFASQIFDAAYPTINRPGSGKFVGLSTNYRGSFFESVWKHAKDRGFHKIFLNCFADPRRDEEWYERTKMALGSKVQQEYPRTEEEALLAGDNVAFPEFSYDTHVCKPFDIPEHWRRVGGVDNGFNDPYAWYKAAISEDGIIYIYYELSRWRDEPQLDYSDQAEIFANSLIHKNTESEGWAKERLEYIVAGLDAWHGSHRDRENKNLIDYYEEGGLERQAFVKAVTDRRLRAATLHEYLKVRTRKDKDGNEVPYTKLKIFSSCEYLIAILPQLTKDERDPEKVADLSDIDNPYDALGYILISRHAEKSREEKKQEMTTMQRHKQRLMRDTKRRRYT